MPSENINFEDEVCAIYISKGQAVFGFQFTPESIINDLKEKSMQYAISTKPLTAKIAKLLKKYHSVLMIKEGENPRITVFLHVESGKV